MVDTYPSYKDYEQYFGLLAGEGDDVPNALTTPDGFALEAYLGGFARLRPPKHVLEMMTAREENPAVYTRQWKVHISLVDVDKSNIDTAQKKEDAITTIGNAWERIIPILKRYNIHAKVVMPAQVGKDYYPEDKQQSKKNIVLYYDRLSDTPEKWRAMLTDIEKELTILRAPAAGEIVGDRAITGSKYFHFSCGHTADGARLDPQSRNAEDLKGSPFEDMVINAAGLIPPFADRDLGTPGRGSR